MTQGTDLDLLHVETYLVLVSGLSVRQLTRELKIARKHETKSTMGMGHSRTLSGEILTT